VQNFHHNFFKNLEKHNYQTYINRKYKHRITILISIESTSIVLQNKKKLFAMLRQQLAIWGQSSELKNLVTQYLTSIFSMKMLFFCYFDCRVGFLDLQNTQKPIFVHLCRVFVKIQANLHWAMSKKRVLAW